VGDYSQAAEFYDLLYAAEKDYAAESNFVASLIRGTARPVSEAADPPASPSPPLAR
jgi:hypothetical protein